MHQFPLSRIDVDGSELDIVFSKRTLMLLPLKESWISLFCWIAASEMTSLKKEWVRPLERILLKIARKI